MFALLGLMSSSPCIKKFLGVCCITFVYSVVLLCGGYKIGVGNCGNVWYKYFNLIV